MAVTVFPVDRLRRWGGRPLGRKSWVAEVMAKPMASYYFVVVAALLLLSIGILMVLSASSVMAYVQHKGDSFYYVRKQFLFSGLGVVAAVFLARLKPDTIRRFSGLSVVLAAVLLLLTFTPLGVSVGGNQNWLDLGVRIQPSEFAKIAIVLWGAHIFQVKEKLLADSRQLLVPFVPVAGAIILLVVAEKDLGTAMVMGTVVLLMLWAVGAPWKMLAGSLGSVLVVIVALVLASPNRMARIVGFLNPAADITGVNQQPLRGIYALASGGIFGKGIGASRQKWGLLSEAHTDYILAVLGEEMGLVGVLFVLALYLTLGFAGLRIASRSDNNFSRFAAVGITSWFMVQSLINIMVVLRISPVLGVTLPLVSYGGSSMLANLCALGILVSCARDEPAARALLARKRRKAKPRVTTVIDSPRV